MAVTFNENACFIAATISRKVMATLIQKAVNGIFAGKGIAFGAFKQPKPVLLVKQ